MDLAMYSATTFERDPVWLQREVLDKVVHYLLIFLLFYVEYLGRYIHSMAN